MELLRNIAKGLYPLIQIIASLALLGLMLVVGGTVIYRWFGGTFQGSYEVAETATIVTITMAIFIATVNRSHVEVRLIHDQLPSAFRRLSKILLGLAAVGFWCLVTWSVYRLALRHTHTGEITDVLHINIVPFRWVTVAGFAALTLVLAFQTMRWITGHPDEDGHGTHDMEEDNHGS